MTSIQRVGVVGAGQMGAGIAEVCARASVDVLVCEADDTRVEAARQRIEGSLARAVRKGKLTTEVHDQAQSHLRYTKNLEDMADRDLVIEAVLEDPEAKVALFVALDEIMDQKAILASNTSSIPIINPGMSTPGRTVPSACTSSTQFR